jgi:hypothetical protein
MDPLHAIIEEFAAEGYTHVSCHRHTSATWSARGSSLGSGSFPRSLVDARGLRDFGERS